MISSYAKNPTAWILSSRYQERTSIRGNHVRTIYGTTFVTLFDYFTALRTPSKGMCGRIEGWLSENLRCNCESHHESRSSYEKRYSGNSFPATGFGAGHIAVIPAGEKDGNAFRTEK